MKISLDIKNAIIQMNRRQYLKVGDISNRLDLMNISVNVNVSNYEHLNILLNECNKKIISLRL